jgi:hypothetical protein
VAETFDFQVGDFVEINGIVTEITHIEPEGEYGYVSIPDGILYQSVALSQLKLVSRSVRITTDQIKAIETICCIEFVAKDLAQELEQIKYIRDDFYGKGVSSERELL